MNLMRLAPQPKFSPRMTRMNANSKSASNGGFTTAEKSRLGQMDAVGFWSSAPPQRRGGLPLIRVNPRDSRAKKSSQKMRELVPLLYRFLQIMKPESSSSVFHLCKSVA
jgi:hypothetical protein